MVLASNKRALELEIAVRGNKARTEEGVVIWAVCRERRKIQPRGVRKNAYFGGDVMGLAS